MDTKLRNYNETNGETVEKKIGWLRSLLCVLAGLTFLGSSMHLINAACRIAHIYDLHYFFLVNGFKSEEAYQASEAYARLSAELPIVWKLTIIYGAIALSGLLLCCIAVRRKVTWFDKIFIEFQLTAFIGAAVGAGAVVIEYCYCYHQSEWMKILLGRLDLSEKTLEALMEFKGWYWLENESTSFDLQWMEAVAMLCCVAALLVLCLLILLSWVKKIKVGCFWRYTLLGWLVIGIRDAIRESKGIQGKIIGILILGAVLSATWIGLIAVLVFIIFFVPRQLKKYKAIRDGVAEVKAGNLDKKISTLRPGEKPGELDRLANDINAISEATSIAVANELKNQRMKTDLISNVSHDLKTPLTSMVSYVDLLKTEGLDSENAPEYLDIIDEKTRRLQKLTEDLFEAAKASSGSIPVNIERIDMTSIISQALAEVGGRLEDANLDVIIDCKAETSFVRADGQLLWRVMENLLVNVSKYALPGSRVYIDVSDRGDGYLLLEMKNMSKDRLNIDADELMERFKRGDESRNTEGSGLGLAIAKDLVALMDGDFSIKVDGDLFKVSVALKRG